MCLLSALRVSSSEFSPRQSDGWIDSAPFPSLLPIPTSLLLCPWDHLLSQGLFPGNPKLRCGDKLGNGESRNPVLRIIDKPTRLEFLTSIALKQHFVGLTVQPNYHVDDEGLPQSLFLLLEFNRGLSCLIFFLLEKLLLPYTFY